VESDSYPNGVPHILRETRAQCRVKVGTDAGRPVEDGSLREGEQNR
jgi:hypothetical protein